MQGGLRQWQGTADSKSITGESQSQKNPVFKGRDDNTENSHSMSLIVSGTFKGKNL